VETRLELLVALHHKKLVLVDCVLDAVVVVAGTSEEEGVVSGVLDSFVQVGWVLTRVPYLMQELR
jgi:hypothetical protein